ncbi:MAG: His-Xaa-Ser system radical SAM maturase HxsB [Deltaproteobacteria bacterium]|nr:His-Xaa-Ser system radical SAM maturase HxsB [Deltaproteobacteria bacterium]
MKARRPARGRKPGPEPDRKPDLMPVRWRELGGRVLVTNDGGDYLWLDREPFEALMAGKLKADHPLWAELARTEMLHDAAVEARVVERVRRRSHHLQVGPTLHVVVLTLRCNHACTYCHASRQPERRAGFDMSLETAARVLDVILASPAPDLTIEFQGGEPALNFPVLRWFVEEGRRRTADGSKHLYFSLVSNLTTLTQAQIDYLVDQGVAVCTSIDGPAELHDRHRRLPGGGSHRKTRAAMARFDAAYRKRRLDPALAYVNALVTVSRGSLARPEALVDEYVRMGQKVVHLRPLNPFGMGRKIWAREGYTADEFLRFWTRALDHILELNRQGIEMAEKMAALLLTRILTDDDPNYADLRSPCGAAIGQLAYNHDGRVYTCDEGRMVGAMGDDLFCIGDVHRHTYADLIAHPTVRSLCVSSCLECLPGCADCAYAPYCGVCPVYNYVEQGDLVARCATNDRCRIMLGMLDYLFQRLAEPGLSELLRRWTEVRDRSSVFEPRRAGKPAARAKARPAAAPPRRAKKGARRK